MEPFNNIWLELVSVWLMIDNLHNEKAVGHQSDRSGLVLLQMNQATHRTVARGESHVGLFQKDV